MSCLFNSFSAIIGEPSSAIRSRICDWLATNPVLSEDMHAADTIMIESGLPLDRYVQRMRSTHTWGGAIEIRAFVELWKRPVRVWVIRTRRWIEFPYSEGNECKISWTGGHYEAMK
jgi:hypothetical protein